MPTACAPCPGKRNASSPMRLSPSLERSGFDLPADQRRAPREPCAERDEEDEIAALDPARAHGFVESDPGARRGGVSDPLDVDVHLRERHARFLGCRLEDPQVDL